MKERHEAERRIRVRTRVGYGRGVAGRAFTSCSQITSALLSLHSLACRIRGQMAKIAAQKGVGVVRSDRGRFLSSRKAVAVVVEKGKGKGSHTKRSNEKVERIVRGPEGDIEL